MKRIYAYLLVLMLGTFLFSERMQAQTHIISHDIDWSTQNQNMWGPNGSPWNINMNINLFDIEFDTAITVGDIVNILGGQFGAEIDIDSWFKIGSDFIISGFTTGSVDVDYPVTIDMEVPDDNTFCPGEELSIESSYTVNNGWKLDTHFPTAGIIGLYLNFGFQLDVDATICVFGCTSFPIINVNVPLDTTAIIELNSITGVFSYPCFSATSFPPIQICHDTILPITFNNLFGIGLSGSITLPYVETEDWLDVIDECNKDLYAAGDCTWVTLEIDVIQLLSAIAGLIPPPAGPAIQQFLNLLSGTIDLGAGFTIDYTLFAAWFEILSTMQQDFHFDAAVWNNLSFPQPVEYSVVDPHNGNLLIDQGVANDITFEACHTLNYIWPCHNTDSMNIGVSHSLSNDFTNHTWDSLSFSFNIAALEFWLNIPSFPIVPPSSIPDFCVEVPYMDSTNNPQGLQDICMPGLRVPGVNSFPTDLSIHIGPLFSYSWPIGYIPITWYNNTWELAGFNDTIFPSFTMATNCPGLEIIDFSAVDVLCYGDSSGTLTIEIANGSAPYTYIWSTGDTIVLNTTISTLTNLASGWYYITVIDNNGCEVSDSAEVIDAYPPIDVSIATVDINCVGGSDGSVSLTVTGGAPPYNYVWDPPQSNSPLASNLPAGTYTITITDNVGCDTIVSATLIELHPLPTINISATPTEGCQPLDVQFYETSPDSGQTYFWDLDEGNHFSSDKDPFLTYMYPGVYDVVLIVTSVYGCVDSVRVTDMITVYTKPVAEFRPYPSSPNLADNTVLFFNESSNTYLSEWYFGDGGFSDLTYPTHTYQDTGDYIVTLYITSEHGCMDTVSHPLYVADVVTMYMPNSFSPDGDGINDYIKPVAHGIYDNEYTFMIFNRWGTLLFETNDYDEYWDGHYNGVLCQHGVYQYVIFYRDKTGVKRKLIGGIQLIR
ncbi:MAG: gliding motility-associated C-terminal domain-containing protein [Bacteroidales bacterium]|nr:gliding motility-associated C-terminal domain-containing protein [Bacteroidales bacterium]